MDIASFMVSWLHSTCQNDGLHRAESLDSLHNGEKHDGGKNKHGRNQTRRKSNTTEEKTYATKIKPRQPNWQSRRTCILYGTP